MQRDEVFSTESTNEDASPPETVTGYRVASKSDPMFGSDFEASESPTCISIRITAERILDFAEDQTPGVR